MRDHSYIDDILKSEIKYISSCHNWALHYFWCPIEWILRTSEAVSSRPESSDAVRFQGSDYCVKRLANLLRLMLWKPRPQCVLHVETGLQKVCSVLYRMKQESAKLSKWKYISSRITGSCRIRTAVKASAGQPSPSKRSGITTLRKMSARSKTINSSLTFNPLFANPSARS